MWAVYSNELGQYCILFGPFATEKEAQAARRTYCLEVRGQESYRRQTRTWVTNHAPPAA